MFSKFGRTFFGGNSGSNFRSKFGGGFRSGSTNGFNSSNFQGAKTRFTAGIGNGYVHTPTTDPSHSFQFWLIDMLMPLCRKRSFSTAGRRFLTWYSEMLEKYPFSTQMVTSGFLGGIADVTTQALEHKWDRDEGCEPDAWDWRRLASVTMFGVYFMGPVTLIYSFMLTSWRCQHSLTCLACVCVCRSDIVWYKALDKFTSAYCRSQGSVNTPILHHLFN